MALNPSRTDLADCGSYHPPQAPCRLSLAFAQAAGKFPLRVPEGLRPRPMAATPNSQSEAPAPERILIVEDEQNARQGYEALLLKWGFEVLGVESAEAALERLADFSPNALIADVELPGMNGLELLERLRDAATSSISLRFSSPAKAARIASFPPSSPGPSGISKNLSKAQFCEPCSIGPWDSSAAAARSSRSPANCGKPGASATWWAARSRCRTSCGWWSRSRPRWHRC